MKNFKRLITATLIALMLVASAYAVIIPRGSAPGFPAIQVFTPTAIVTVSSASSVTVTSYTVVMFDSDLNIYINDASSATYSYVANTPLGIAAGVTTIHVDAACAMLVM